jgi:acyl-CoA reductase-like NAD-dependent aldehyde dehydrogenase
VVPVKAEQYDDEFLSDLNVKMVADLDDAIAHIREHGTQHSDAILTRTAAQCRSLRERSGFLCGYVNASPVHRRRPFRPWRRGGGSALDAANSISGFDAEPSRERVKLEQTATKTSGGHRNSGMPAPVTA